MITRKEIKDLFNVAELENENELRRTNTFRKEELSAEQKARRLEFLVEHLNVGALIAIHQTDHFPENGIIRPTGHFLLNLFQSKNAQKIIQDLQLKHPRITVHFTLNFPIKGVVAGGEWVEWKGKYGILIPVENLIDRIICLNPVDSWIIGDLDLPSSAEILINEEEYFQRAEIWHALAGKAKVVPYPKELDIHNALINRIKKKGYNHIPSGGDYWFQGSDLNNVVAFINDSPFLSNIEKDKLIRLCVQKGFIEWSKVFEKLAKDYKKLSGRHNETLWRDIENFAEDLYGLIFDPAPTEISTKTEDIIFWKLRGKKSLARRYIDELNGLLHSQQYKNPHEIEYLKELINTLTKIEKLISNIINKIESEGKLKQTWGEFLKSEKII